MNGGSAGSITISTSTTGDINSNGGSGDGVDGNGGNGGTITISNSTTTGAINSNGGIGNYGGNGGLITITSSGNLDLSNKSISAGGATNFPYGGNGANGSLTITYFGTLNVTGATASALSDLQYILSGHTADLGAFVGGSLPPPPSAFPNSTITTNYQCSNLSLGGTYYLGADISGSCNITGNEVTLIGQHDSNSSNGQYTIGGGVTSVSGVDINLQNITVTGNVESGDAADGSPAVVDPNHPSDSQDAGNGSGSGSITISTSTVTGSVITGSAGNGGGPGIESGQSGSGGSSGSVVVNNSTVGLIITGKGGNGSDTTGNSYTTAGGGGSSGSITISGNSTAGSLTTGYGGNGGSSDDVNYDSGSGGSSGSVTITNSTAGDVITNNAGSDGDGAYSSGSGGGGSVTVNNSIVGSVNTGAGSDIVRDGPNGGDGGSITISTSTITGLSIISGAGGASTYSNSGSGGFIKINNSTTTSVTSITSGSGGSGSTDFITNVGGNGGPITLTSLDNLDLSNKGITAGIGGTGYPNSSNGSLTITYANDITTNNSTYFNNVADLRINTVDYGPWNGVFNPQKYYFNDTATNGTVSGDQNGDWGDVNNWWTDSGFITPAGSIPNEINPVIVDGNITQNSSSTPAKAFTLTLQGSAQVGISVKVMNGALFNGSSINNGDVNARTNTFNGASANNGTTTGTTTFSGASSNTGLVLSNSTTTFNGDLASSSGLVAGISVSSANFTDTPGSMNFTTTHFPILANSISGSDSNGGTISDDGDGNIISTVGGIVATISYSTGVIQSNANTYEDIISTINYTYSYNVPGSTSTPITRVFTSNASTTRDYTTEAGHNNWLLVASNAVVDLTGAIYDRTTNMFQALLGGLFISGTDVHGDPTHVTPVVVMSSPVAGTNVKWSPNINWDTANNSGGTCEYSYDNFASDDHFVSCASGGSDIPRPSTLNSYNPSTQYTLYLRATDPKGNVTQTNGVTFSYDNTQPVWTACGTDLLDESRTYYLTANTSADCHITTDNVTLEGASTTNSNGFTLNANVIAASAYNVNFSNININGSIPTTGNFIVSSTTISNSVDINGSLTSDATSTFAGATVESGATLHGGTFSGNVVNNGTLTNSTVLGNTINNGTITGNFTMNGSSSNNGTTTGSLTLNASSTNAGFVTGNLIFNMLTAASSTVTFSGSTAFAGTGHVGGNIKDSNGNNITKWIFSNTSSNTGYTKGNANFNDSSTNTGTIVGTAYFSDSSSNASGTVNGNANIYYNVATPLTGTVTGTKTYYSYPNDISFGGTSGSSWSNIANWYTDTTLTTHLGRLPVSGENVVLFASTTLSTSTTNNIFIARNGVTISGNGSSLITINGSISGNGVYGGHDAYNFNIAKIVVTGTITANGSAGASTGGKGGTLSIATSTTGNIIVDGGNGTTQGGDGGTVSIIHSLEIASSTSIIANGGDATVCGAGGNGGNITVVGSTYDIQIVNPGNSQTSTGAGKCPSPIDITNPPIPGGNTSSGGGFVSAPSDPGYVAPVVPVSTPTPVAEGAPSVSGGGPYTYVPGIFTPGVLNGITLPNINIPGKLSFKPLPTFNGTGTKSFNFLAPISNFLNGASISWNGATALQAYLTSLGITRDQDLVALSSNPIQATTTKKIPGLFKVSVSTLPTKVDGTFTTTYAPVTSYFTSNSDSLLSQSVTILSGSTITVSLTPATKVKKITGTWNGQPIKFNLKNGIASVTINVPSYRGSYMLKTNASPIPLTVIVKTPVVVSPPPPSPIQSILDKVLGWFGW